MSKLKINGKIKEFPNNLPLNLTELLDQLDIKAETVVAEIDGQIIEKQNFNSTKLNENQAIELIRFVPGG